MVPRFFSLGQDHSVKGPFSKRFKQLKPMPSHFWLQLQAFILIRDFICKEFKTYNLALFLRGISIKMPANVIIKKAPIVFPTSIYNCYTTAYLNFLFVLTQPPNCHLRSLFCLPKDCFHQQHRRPRSKRAHQCHINCEVSRQETPYLQLKY